MTISGRLLYAAGALLGEGPVVFPDGSLVWVDLLSGIVARLDHRMLLPTHNRLLDVSTATIASLDGGAGRAEVTVWFKDRRWVFPADECVLLPLVNTTAEWLACWIGRELLCAMAAAGSPITGSLRLEVDECLGQSATWEWRPENG